MSDASGPGPPFSWGLTECRVKLAWIERDGAAEFSDMIGESGTLRPGRGERLTFMPDNRGDWLTMAAREVVEKDGTIRVATRLDNVFVFRVLAAPPQPRLTLPGSGV